MYQVYHQNLALAAAAIGDYSQEQTVSLEALEKTLSLARLFPGCQPYPWVLRIYLSPQAV